MPLKPNPKVSLREISQITGGIVLGNPDVIIQKLAPLDTPDSTALTFISELGASAVNKRLKSFQHAAAFIQQDVSTKVAVPDGVSLIAVPNPLAAIVKCVPLFFEPHRGVAGIHSSALVDPSAKIGTNVSIGAYSVISPLVSIGDNVTIHPHVVIYPGAIIGADTTIHSHASVREDCVVGENCVVQNGTVIGADGFGYIPDPEVGLRSVPQIGIVRIGKNVEIGANSCIDRATLAETIIGTGAKLDNQVQVGHNTKIGNYAIICGQVGIAGSAEISDGVVLGGGVGVADHIKIAKGVRVGGHSGVTSDLTEPGDYVGMPAVPATTWRRHSILLSQLNELLPKIKSIIKGR